MTSTALKNKFELIWIKLTSKSNALARRAKHIARLMDVSKPRYAPTLLELCFLICSIFPEEFSIPVDDLVIYMMGLNVFKHVHDMIEARHLIYDIILSNRSMIKLCGRNYNRLGDRKFDEEKIQHDVNNTGWLLNELRREKEECDDQYVKLLADGRGAAKLIASKYGLLFGRENLRKNWLFRDEYDYEDYNGLSLVLKEVTEYSIHALCPKLALLHLQHGKDTLFFPVGSFSQLRNLRVLSLDIPSLTQSLELPRNLRTLRLKVLKLEDISWIGRLECLEFLSISTLSLRHVPEDMKELRNLRLLDLRESMNLVYIPPGVLSRMQKLEELYLPLSYKRWGCRGKEDDDYDGFESEEGEKINASFSEITSLSLYALQIGVQDASVLPRKTSIFKRIKLFSILIHNDFKYQPLCEGRMNKLQLTGDACDIKQCGIWDLMRRVEDLSLIR